MIAEAGLAALWLAAGLAAFQFLLMILALRSAGATSRGAMRSIAVVQGVLTLDRLCHAADRLRAERHVGRAGVREQQQREALHLQGRGRVGEPRRLDADVGDDPRRRRRFSGAVVASYERADLARALGAQAVLALGFYAFLLIASNPFARLWPAPPDGQGLNPLLQDPGFAFHPPTLYLGYVGLSVAFSLAVGALLTGEVDSRLARAMRPWVLGAWILLTLGITAGSYWAYYELGWGGYWFWDPVENASLMPWLAATALLHSINVLAARGALKAWTMMLAVIAFSMSMVGTFLVRSGILTSVHAFAIDPERGTFLLALLAIYVGAAFTLFAIRGATLKEGAPFELVSRESGLVINNLILTVILGVVFVGTLYPLFVEAVSGEKLSVGAPYFNAVAGPLALLLAVLVGIGPLLALAARTRPVSSNCRCPRCLASRPRDHDHPLARDAHPAAAWLHGRRLSCSCEHPSADRPQPSARAARDLGDGRRAFRDCVALLGMAANAAFTSQRLAIARPGEILSVGPWQVQLQEVTPTAGKNWTARGRARAARGDGPRHARAPNPLFFRSADGDQRVRHPHLLERAALHGRRQAGRVRCLAAAPLVEAVRDLDLGRRRPDRTRRRAGAAGADMAPACSTFG